MLVRYNPWQEMNAIQRQLNRLFDEVPATSEVRAFTRVPAAEINETADAIHLKLELPGMEAKDLDVQVTENAVAISPGEKPKGLSRSEWTTLTLSVHHANFTPEDNRVSNLIPLCSPCHIALHSRARGRSNTSPGQLELTLWQ